MGTISIRSMKSQYTLQLTDVKTCASHPTIYWCHNKCFTSHRMMSSCYLTGILHIPVVFNPGSYIKKKSVSWKSVHIVFSKQIHVLSWGKRLSPSKKQKKKLKKLEAMKYQDARQKEMANQKTRKHPKEHSIPPVLPKPTDRQRNCTIKPRRGRGGRWQTELNQKHPHSRYLFHLLGK